MEKKQNQNKRILTIIALCLICFVAIVFAAHLADPASTLTALPSPSPSLTPVFLNSSPSIAPIAKIDGKLQLFMLDIGQGDSIFLISPSGKTMLIDSGEASQYETVKSFLDRLGISGIDVVVATHPHADHIGCMYKIINDYQIDTFYLTSASTTTKTYSRMLDALEKSADTEVVLADAAAAHPFIDWDDNVEVRIISPFSDESYTDLNNSSIMLHVKFGGNAIMLTGDAETAAETIALSRLPASYFEADILKVGHHGSSSSTSSRFLSAINPKIALISLGKDNSYGHPHRETILNLDLINALIYRTDESGTICVTMDGISTVVKTEK